MPAPYSPVVVGFDFSHTGRAALERGVDLAARAPHHVLHVACVVDPRRPIPSIPSYHGVDEMYAARVQEALAYAVQEELERVEARVRVHFFVHARVGRPVEELLALAREVSADLVIVGSHGLTGLERLVIGSVSEKIVREAGCSVEVARPKRYPALPVAAVVDAAARTDHTPIPPHRYEYEDRRVQLRPAEWPL